jgi:tRNA dimethylallyltransferase
MKQSIISGSPLIVVLGPTASGKSALAMDLALRFDGEIIAADSRTVYTGMNIGTAKPTPEDRRLVRHHLIDIVSPDESFTVADFQTQAKTAIADILSRGKLPFLVGGSGLYIDSVIYNFSFRHPAKASDRTKLQALSVDELQGMLQEQGIDLPNNERNPRHLIRALETKGDTPQRDGLRPNTLVIGLAKDRAELEVSIRKRVDAMVDEGFVQEVRSLASRYGWDAPALQAPGYKAFRPLVDGGGTLEDAKQQFVRYDLQYAKRQMTWFKRNEDIVWISKSEEAVDRVTTLLNN